MVFMLENLFKDNLHDVFQFLTADGNLFENENCIFRMAAVEWCNTFWQCRDSTNDFSYPICAHVAASDEMWDSWKLLYEKIGTLKLEKSLLDVEISLETIHSIMHSVCYHSVAAQWIPQVLTDEQKIFIWFYH